MRLFSLGIRSRIYGGSAVLVAIGIGLAGLAIAYVTSIDRAVATLGNYSANNTRVLEAMRRLEKVRRISLRYKISGEESMLVAGKQLEAEIEDLLGTAAATALSPVRKQQYQAIKAGVHDYETMWDEFGGILKQVNRERALLFTGGDELSAAVAALVATPRAGGNPEWTAAVSRLEAAVLLVRVSNWRFLATSDPQGPATFTTNLAKAAVAVDALGGLAVGVDEQRQTDLVRRSLASYADAFRKVSSGLLASDDIFDKRMRPAIDKLLTDLEGVQSSLAHDTDVTRDATAATISNAIKLQASIAVLALIIGTALAFLIGRAIVRPIGGMTGAMTKLANGDTGVEIPSQDAVDELGAMARAVQVFKEAAISKLRLENEAEESRHATELARQRNEAERAAAAEAQSQVVTAIGAGLEALSHGDLTARLDQVFAAEYEGLRANFNAAMAQLHELVTGIVANTGGLRSGTSEIAQAADDLSRRTEQQAASLEETAAALEQITTTVRRTAEGAKQAGAAVGQAQADADKSGSVVREAVSAMSEIERSAQQIGQIIGVIDEIAFQTNLLALNAGVEAARAGDAGRGFAVVASEVRALAQRSAEAAKEIKALISTSTQQVGRGVDLVGETGRALGRIVEQVAGISTVVTQIAASAEEQATGLVEVNTAVSQMDQVTQQNAAMVEQSTAASHALAQETEQLAALTGRFQLGAESAGAVPAERAPRKPAAPIRNRAKPALKVVNARRPAEAETWKEF